MAATQTLPPLTKHDLHGCPTSQLAEFAYLYFADEESLALVVAELEARGLDPYA